MPDGFVDLGLGTGGIAGIVAGGLLLVTIIAAGFAVWLDDDGWGGFVAFVGAFVGMLATAVAVLVWVLSCWPVWDVKYAHVYEVNGVVTSVTNSFTSDGGEYSRIPIVTVEGVDVPLIVNDARAVSLEGQHARFVCSPTFVYQGADAYECVVG